MSTPRKGGIRDIQERLNDWLIDCLNDEKYSSYYISINDTEDITKLSSDYLIQILVISSPLRNETFGRRLPSAGSMVTYSFTMYIYGKESLETPTLVHQIQRYFEDKDQDVIENADHGIVRVFDIGIDEIDPSVRDRIGFKITGRIWVKRLDLV